MKKEQKFEYKNNVYLKMSDNSYRIRSSANVDGCGYSWYFVKDEKMVEILDEYLEE